MRIFYFVMLIVLAFDFILFMQRAAYWLANVLEGRHRLNTLPFINDEYARILRLYKRAKVHTISWAVISLVTFCFYLDCISQLAR